MSTHSKICSAAEAVAAIRDGATIAITGSGGGLLEPDELLAALERRFVNTGRPRNLTIVHAQGIGDGALTGLNRIAHEGLVRRVIGAHWTWSPRMQQLAMDERIEAYALPGGVIQHLIRESGAGRPGLLTRVGLGTTVDPRREGGRLNRRAHAALGELVEFDGLEYIRFKPLPIDVAILRAHCADHSGNASFLGEGAELDALTLAIAAKNGGGKVLLQVRSESESGRQRAQEVRLPGALVSSVVIVPDQRWSHAGEPDGAGVAAAARIPQSLPPERSIIAARASLELTAGAIVSYGFGMPDAVAVLAPSRPEFADTVQTVDHGHYGGQSLHGALFGFVLNANATIDSAAQFDFYSGGGVDIAVLGFGEFDRHGNVNVSKLGDRPVGPGGFIDIAHRARKLVFCGTFETRGLKLAKSDSALQILQPGALAKIVDEVAQVTFSGAAAVSKSQEVLYVTERAVFRLTSGGLVLSEIAPGIDLQRDVLERMAFRPLLPEGGPALMPAGCFSD